LQNVGTWTCATLVNQSVTAKVMDAWTLHNPDRKH
jgi:hypothetical protein